MEIELLHQPDSAIAKIHLAPGEELIAQAGAMVAMSSHINPSTSLHRGKGGSLLGAFGRILAGQSLFLSVFRTATPAEIFLAPKLMGDLLICDLADSNLVVQSGSYLASASTVNLDLGFQGLKSVFSGEGLFWLDLSGIGPVLLTSFGGIYTIPVNGEYIVDTGHIVAFEKSLNFAIDKAGDSWLGSFLGGEGLVCRFQGQGKVYCQTHNNYALRRQVGSKLSTR